MTRVKPFRPVALVIALAAGLLAAGPAGAAPPAGAPQREPAQVDERVTADLEKDGKADVWAVFGERTDLTGADAIDDWDAKGQYVYDRLTATADASQASARKQLETAGADFEPFWISNRILVRGADEALTGQIAAMDGVEKVTASVELANEKPTPAEAEAGLDAVEWGIAAINADDVWAQFGSRGEGSSWPTSTRGSSGTTRRCARRTAAARPDGVNHNYNWFDPGHHCDAAGAVPCDNNGHGTHTMGTMVGDGRGQPGGRGAGGTLGRRQGLRYQHVRRQRPARVGPVDARADRHQRGEPAHRLATAHRQQLVGRSQRFGHRPLVRRDRLGLDGVRHLRRLLQRQLRTWLRHDRLTRPTARTPTASAASSQRQRLQQLQPRSRA